VAKTDATSGIFATPWRKYTHHTDHTQKANYHHFISAKLTFYFRTLTHTVKTQYVKLN